jgi:hypothetical protein
MTEPLYGALVLVAVGSCLIGSLGLKPLLNPQ